MRSRSNAVWLLLGVAALIAIIGAFLPPIPQPLAYHNFADQRSWLGIPNFGDVASNLPFAIFGVWGLAFVLRLPPGDPRFVDSAARWPYAGVFFGLLLTAVGSSYYHLAPDNARLVWDRLPMTVVFTSLVAAVIAERISVRLGRWLWPLLLLLGAGSVWQWRLSELRGHGDLRFYAAVQVYSALVLLLTLLLPAHYTRGEDFLIVVGSYVLAKILETADKAVFSVGHVVSGHTLKHLAAAGAGYWILRMLTMRETTRQTFNPG